ncbi:fimbrial protein [Salmonella enterica subsp. enterica serovar Portland]|uniref:fimbrial protein n=1 Tax=Salmonella enterica TaxID=28901 RepID=UPI00127CEF33|nr:fimbrial protein [Salmonella enterica]EBX6015100.1 type 1 fimbrial protein [Salmonella enterica subsp. enterica serovar Dortmund]ECA8972580.1 type 1 fimbrial protein [Salmonella enterica subsp. enterica serovar Omuna]ECE0504753.1 type 1 fimbrial protein [Salmonella enterica subsp. enterica]EDH5632433.1 type 1 fimbrial protein [Salmonella enterica subsp. enterica serovar Claibornei]EDS6041032.1 fimbrial protein [Salmonella enterica subsp. enterica serovar Lexington]EEB9698080.1 fimbrial pro
MRNKLIALALLTSAGMSASAMADDGKVNFVGNIIESGCEVNSSISSPMNVTLGDVAKTAFNAAGDTAANTEFTLVLTNCPTELQGKPVVVKYDGTPDQTNNDYLQLTDYGSTGVASGVAIQLLNASGSELPLGNSSESTVIAASGSTNLNFFARYIATAAVADIDAGTANGSVNFTLAYN